MEETENMNEELEIERTPETQVKEKKLSKKAKMGIIIGAASAIVIAIITVVCIIAFGGKSWQKLYDGYLVGKAFESDGRTLTFDENNRMTYSYTNGIGNSYRYVYSIIDMIKEDDKITLTLEQTSANRNDENIDKDKQIKAIYFISDDTVEYYKCKYTLESAAPKYDQALYNKHLSGKVFENDGRELTFDNNGNMTYNFINGMGDTYRYVYSIVNMTQENGKIILALEQSSANRNDENTDKDELITVTYSISSNTIKYYSLTYICVK